MDVRLRAGVGLFNAGEFFEAHEVWEQLWLDTVSGERPVLQALIQIAAGYHKHEIGVSAGAIKLLAAGMRTLQASPSRACGLDIETFRTAVAADLQRLRVGAPSAPVQAPQLRFAT